MMSQLGYEHVLIFGSVMVAAWFLFIYFWPRLLLSVYKRAILVKGFGDGPIPVNTLYTEPQALFADPLHPPSSGSSLMTTGVNHDTLATVGVLDLRKGPQVLHVPDMAGRYYSVQFTDPSNNTNFAYVGKRTTGTEAGDYLISGPGWQGAVPPGMTQISSPNNSVLVLGRTLVESDRDLPTVYGLAKQIQFTPLSSMPRGGSIRMDQVARNPALRRLDVFVGAWTMEAVFPSNPTEVLRGGQSTFEWMKGEQLLVQRTEAPASAAPDSIAITVANPDNDAYTQHYFDSRGVARLYAMTWKDGVWTLVRESPDFSPLAFSQRFTGTFADDNTTIWGVWEKSSDGVSWEKDFDLTYRRIR